MNKKDLENQDNILNYTPPDYKEMNVLTYTIKINSKDRNYSREPNPFNFEIIFNEDKNVLSYRKPVYTYDNKLKKNVITSYINEYTKPDQKAVITSKFENIKRISLSQLIVPRYVPRDYMGEPVTGITPNYNTPNSVCLSFYPGININNTVITFYDTEGNASLIEVLELVDLSYKKMYLVALQYNNPYYIGKYITVKAELFSHLNINNNIYPITNIVGNIISLSNTTNFPLPLNTNNRLILGDFYKNVIMSDINGTRIGINNTTIQILSANLLNFQYLFEGQYLEYQINSSSANIVDRKLFKISNITYENENLPLTVENVSTAVLIIKGMWTDGLPSTYNNSPLFFDHIHIIRLSQFNFGVKDLFEEKLFYLNLSPYKPAKDVSTDEELNKSFGILFPSTPNSTKDYLYLRGDASESYTNVNLQNTNNKIQFTLTDSNNQLLGKIYSKFFNLYQPNNNVELTSYLPFLPDLNMVLKIEELDKKFAALG